jgi:hypothetical protein
LSLLLLKETESDRLQQWTQSGNGVSNKRLDFQYNDANQLVEMSRFSNLSGSALVAQSLYDYDKTGRLKAIAHSRRDGSSIANYTYGYDAALTASLG